MKRKHILILGAVLILAGLVWGGCNLLEEHTAATHAQDALIQFEQGTAASAPDSTSGEAQSAPEDEEEEPKPIVVDGQDIICALYMPSLNLGLPVNGAWSYDLLKHVPCRYSGSLAEDNLIVMGHDYRRHFGRLDKLQPGALVYITDAEGTRYDYQVTEQLVIAADEPDKINEGDWNLTLFTCTRNENERLVVRCKRIQSV